MNIYKTNPIWLVSIFLLINLLGASCQKKTDNESSNLGEEAENFKSSSDPAYYQDLLTTELVAEYENVQYRTKLLIESVELNNEAITTTIYEIHKGCERIQKGLSDHIDILGNLAVYQGDGPCGPLRNGNKINNDYWYKSPPEILFGLKKQQSNNALQIEAAFDSLEDIFNAELKEFEPTEIMPIGELTEDGKDNMNICYNDSRKNKTWPMIRFKNLTIFKSITVLQNFKRRIALKEYSIVFFLAKDIN